MRDKILELFPIDLEPDDVLSTISGDHGVDVKLSPLAKRLFSYSVECKNCESLNIWKALDQCETNTMKGTSPLLVIKRNNVKPYVVLNLESFLELFKEKHSTTVPNNQ